MLCRICIVQIQPRKYVLYHADHTAPTRQHELDHTDQEYICPERSRARSGHRLSARCEEVYCAEYLVLQSTYYQGYLHSLYSWVPDLRARRNRPEIPRSYLRTARIPVLERFVLIAG